MAVVIVIKDYLEEDFRAERYIEQLNGSGIAVAEVMTDHNTGESVDSVAEILAADPRFSRDRIGILTFGGEASAVFRAEYPFSARVMLYPGCSHIMSDAARASWLVDGDMVLMFGAEDPSNTRVDCAKFAREMRNSGSKIRLIEYAGAGFAWDRPGHGFSGSLIPAPGLDVRIEQRFWPEQADLSATNATEFFRKTLIQTD
jgi:dienelactone hydrolase